MAKKIAYAIARESSGDKTLANQFADIRKAAKDLGYEIVQEFGENISGNIAKYDYANPSFIEDLQIAIKRKKPDAIFCVSMDRVTRTPVMQGKYLMDFSVIPQIPIYFTRYKRWTIDPITKVVDKDWIDDLATEKGSKTERLNIVARTTPQREKNGKEGFYIGHLSDGYCVTESWGTYEDGHRRKIKKIIIDEDRKKVIEDIFKWYRNGYSISKIADLLNSDNILTTNAYRASTPEKFGHRQKYKGRDGVLRDRISAKWNGSLVSQILSNPWYKGERIYNGTPLTHDAIIAKEEWEEVKAIREANKVSFRNKSKASKHVFLLSDLFYCGKCGRKMYGHYTGLNNHYYCSSIDFMEKCGLTGICKENVEAIIHDIIINKALKSQLEDTDDFIITDYFKLDKKEEKEYKERISNNKKIISKSDAEIERLKKSAFDAGLSQSKSDDPRIKEMYDSIIIKLYDDISKEEEKKAKCLIENKEYNRILSSNSNIKDILKNTIMDRGLLDIKELFQQAIDNVIIFNAEKRDDVVRIKFKNGKESEFIYCARLLGNNYILLENPIHYDENSRLIVSYKKPLFIFIDNDDIVCFSDKGNDIEETKYYSLENGITVNDFVRLVRKTNIPTPFVRLEEETELAKEQRVHYQHWRKKFNTGGTKGIEPYILHNESYEEINLLRKRLYNKAYKIKNKKKLTEEEKEEKLAEIKRQLDALTVQVPLIKPRKKRESKKNDRDWEILTEPLETD